MSSDMSVTGMSKSVANDLSPTSSAAQRAGEAAVSTSSSSNTAHMTSLKELQQAEIQGQKIPVGEEELIKTIEKANKAIQGITTTFEFKIHESTKQIMVKVLDKDTGKVVREIPPEKILDMVAKFMEKAGIIVDERR